MKGSLIIVGFFVLGTICGVCHLLPFDIAETNISYYALCALMFSVGLSVGNDPQTLKNFRSLNPRLVFCIISGSHGYDYFSIFQFLSGRYRSSIMFPNGQRRQLPTSARKHYGLLAWGLKRHT